MFIFPLPSPADSPLRREIEPLLEFVRIRSIGPVAGRTFDVVNTSDVDMRILPDEESLLDPLARITSPP